MGILSNFFGKRRCPMYTYKAVVDIFKNEDYCDTDCEGGFYSDMTIHYYADTLCSLGRLMRVREPDPGKVTIFEIKNGREIEVPKTSYTQENGSWRSKNSLCESNKRYGVKVKSNQ